MAGPTPRPFRKAFACAAVAFVVIAGAALAAFWLPNDPSVGSQLAGELVALVAIPALVVGFFARRSAKVWPMWKVAAWYIVVLVVCLVATISNAVKPPS